ncbi:hypothetical protein X925_09490 [Petrotoga sp. 9T1HF07.CasAA.8.2]|nr:hypothetical protein X925_09490 [Petrotoga sp. 9T1HF07.CasAA.8.2]
MIPHTPLRISFFMKTAAIFSGSVFGTRWVKNWDSFGSNFDPVVGQFLGHPIRFYIININI